VEEKHNEDRDMDLTENAHGVADVLTLEEIANLAAEEGQPAETLMNVVALIAKRFDTDVCSAYLLEPDRANLVLAATVGLRRECIGHLRMAIHEGLADWWRNRCVRWRWSKRTRIRDLNIFPEAGEDEYQSFLECR